MRKHDTLSTARVQLGRISRSTRGGVNGAIEFGGLHTAGFQLS